MVLCIGFFIIFFSFLENLDIRLEDFISNNLKKVKYLRTPARQGLIRARMFGANHAHGKVSPSKIKNKYTSTCSNNNPKSKIRTLKTGKSSLTCSSYSALIYIYFYEQVIVF